MKYFDFMNANVVVLTLSRIVQNFPRRMFMPYFSLYVLALGGTSTEIGIVRAVGTVAVFIVLPMAGYLTDMIGRVKIIPLGGYLMAFSYVFAILAKDWSTLALCIFLEGLASFYYPALGAIQADSLPPKQRAMGLAVVMVIPQVVTLVSPYIGAHIITNYGMDLGMRYLFVSFMICMAVSATMRLKFFKETFKRQTTSGLSFNKIPSAICQSYRNVIEVLKWMPKSLKGLAVILTLASSLRALVGPLWVVYAIEVIKLTTLEWGTLGLISTGIRIVLAIPAGALIDKVGKRKTLIPSLLLSILPTFYFFYAKTFVEVLIVAMIIAGVNAFVGPASQALLADIVPREKRGGVMSTVGRGNLNVSGPGAGGGLLVEPTIGVLATLPVIAFSLLGGYIYTLDPAYPWLLTTGAFIVNIIMCVFFVKEPKEMEA